MFAILVQCKMQGLPNIVISTIAIASTQANTTTKTNHRYWVRFNILASKTSWEIVLPFKHYRKLVASSCNNFVPGDNMPNSIDSCFTGWIDENDYTRVVLFR